MDRQADLSPPLGWMGGPCKVVERIEEAIRSPHLREQLSEKVESGQKLTNPEAAKVYSLEGERGAGPFQKIRISPHAQYRMDQRAITVGDIRVALKNFGKQLNDWKSQKAWQYDHYLRTVATEAYQWIDKRLGDLVVVFRPFGRGVVDIVTTYWQGLPDPRPETCGLHPRHAALTVDEMSGARTWVKNPRPQTSDTDSGKYPTRGLPSPPWKREKPTRSPQYNVPGESGSDSGGSVHKDKARTKGTPGGQYDGGKTHPTPDVTDSPYVVKRRPAMTADADIDWDDLLRQAGMYPPAFPGGNRQREQRGRAYYYFHKRYLRQRGKTLMRQKRRHRRLKPNGRYQADRQRRKDHPERFERRPGGGAKSIAERGQKQREQAKKAFEPISFYHYTAGMWGHVTEVSPCGYIHFEWEDGERGVVEYETFFDEVIVDEDQLDDLFRQMDTVFEFGGSESPDEDAEEDPLFDTWLTQGVKTALQVKYRPDKRQKKRRGKSRWKSRQWYRRNRAKAKVRSRRRYKRIKKHPGFKKQQKIRRKHPERFKRRLAEVLTAPEIAFVFVQPGLPLGYVRNISGMTGLVHFYLAEPGARLLRSLPARQFILDAVFLSPEDEDAFFNLTDAEIGLEAYDFDPDDDPNIIDSDLVNLYTIESDFMHTTETDTESDVDDQLIDPTDDDWFYGIVNKLASEVKATFFREQRPPEMAPDTTYNRGTPYDDRKRHRRPQKPSDVLPYTDEVEDSNPGSRVLPTGKGHVEKDARFEFRSLPHNCQKALYDLPKTPVWKRYQSGRGRDVDVLAWLRKNGWDSLTRDGLHQLFDHIFHMDPTRVGSRTAALIHEIQAGVSPDLLVRSKGITFRQARVDGKNAVWLFDVQGTKGTHRVRLKAVRKGARVRNINKLHVKVSCTCPFWQWQGPEHWAKEGGYLFGSPRGLATKPDVKDPNGQHRACKHVLAILQHVADQSWTLPAFQNRRGHLRYGLRLRDGTDLHYLADTLREGEVLFEAPDFEMRSLRLARRYVASMEVA